MFEDIVNLEEKTELLIALANKNRDNNNLHHAKEYALMALDTAEKLNDKMKLVKILNIIGLCYADYNQYNESINYYHKALSLCDETHNKNQFSITLNNLASIYSKIKNTDKALEYYLQAIEYDNDNFRSINNAALIYYNRKEYNKAKPLFERAYDIALNKNILRSQIITTMNKADLARSIFELDEAYLYMKHANDLLSNIESYDLHIYYCLNMGEILLTDNKNQEAGEYFIKALDLSEKTEDKNFSLESVKVLKRYYATIKDYKTAYEYACKENLIRETLFNDELNYKIASLSAGYEIEQKELKTRQLLDKSFKLLSVGVMAAGITHEINQPLNAISVSANSILYWDNCNKGVLPELFLEEVQQIVEGTDRIDSIIKHMRSFFQTGEDNEILDMFDLNEAVNSALNLLERQIYSHGILLKKDLTKTKVIQRMSRINIEQIIINLVTNSIHSLDECKHNNKTINVVTEKVDSYFIVSISDNGIGISDLDKDRIFDPLFSTKKPGKGTGLGLAIVKNLLERIKSTISVDNNHDKGVTFIVKIKIEDINENITCR